MQNQSFRFISNSGQPTKGGGVIAAISSIIVVAASLVIGSFLLFFGLIVAVGLVIAFFIWKLFFFNKTKKKAEEFLRQNAEMFGQTGGPHSTNSRKSSSKVDGKVIDGDFEEVSQKRD